MDKLKNCPFCNGNNIESQGKDISGIETVKCSCGLVYPKEWWNIRPELDVDKIEAIRKKFLITRDCDYCKRSVKCDDENMMCEIKVKEFIKLIADAHKRGDL